MRKNPISFGSLIRPTNSGQNPACSRILYFHTKYLNGNILSFTYPNQAIQNLKFIYIDSRGDHFPFGLVFIKKSNQPEFFLKNQNRFKPTSFGSLWFGFFGQKPVWLGFGLFWLSFFRFGFGLVRFFGFRLIKSKPNRSVFFKILIGLIDFFFMVRFLQLFFFQFSQFFGLFAHP